MTVSEPEEISENPMYKSEYKEEIPIVKSVEVFEERDEDTLEL